MRMSASILSDLEIEELEKGKTVHLDSTWPPAGVISTHSAWRLHCMFSAFWRVGQGAAFCILCTDTKRFHWRMYYSEQKHRT
jgi:hypothetical protein